MAALQNKIYQLDIISCINPWLIEAYILLLLLLR